MMEVAVTRTDTDSPGDREAFLLGGRGARRDSPSRMLGILDFRKFSATLGSDESSSQRGSQSGAASHESRPACQNKFAFDERARALFTTPL